MSNKRLFLLLGFVLAIVGAKADEVAFSVPDFSIEPGETKEISLVMTSTSDDMKFNFNGEMILSEGLSFVSEQVWDDDNEEYVDTYVFRTDRLKTSHTISENLKAANDLSFVVSAGTKFLSFRAGDAVLTFKVKAAENMELGTASVKLTGMSAAGEDAIELVAQPEYTATVTITKKFSVTVSPADETMGSVTGNGTYEAGTEVTITATPNEGYQFSKWSDNTEVNPYVFTVNSDVSLTATFVPIIYNLSYDLANGTLPEGKTNPETYTIESEDIVLNNPERTGYNFAGWTGTGLEEATQEVKIAKGSINDRSYTATWTPVTYAINYDLAGGALSEGESNPESYTIENEAITLKNPTKTGYTFVGWTGTDLEAATLEVTIAIGKYGDRSYTATWTPVTYAISYDLAGGALVEGESNPVEYTIESEAITLKNPTKTGYTFAGWTGTDLAEATAAVTIAKGSTGNRSYTATWTINQYVMTFVLDNGEENIVKTQDYDSALTAPEAPVKTGFTFKGWSPDVPAKVPASDQTFTAQWERNSYVLKFVADGVTVKEERVLYEGEIVKPEDPQKEGYTFTGWTPEVAETMPAEDVTYTAQFTVNQYTISFNSDGGTAVESITADYQSALTKPADPTKTGYDFAGWEPEFPETMPLNGASLKATWTPVTYTLTYDLAGGALAEGITNVESYTIESEAITLNNPTREGYTFAGWTGTDLTEATSAVTIAKGSTGNRSYTATWTINQYVMTFVLDNGEENIVKTQDYDSALTAPEAPVKTGFTFKGWSPDVPAKVPASDQTFTAQWERNIYVLKFVADGVTVKEERVLYEGEIVKPEDPQKEGYTFTGWTPEVAGTMPAEDVTYTAQFSLNQYTITFNSDGGTAVESVTADYQSALTKPADPTKTGYDFAGWEPEFPETMPLNGASLKATWTPVTYTITYDLAGGALAEGITNVESYTIESEAITLNNPTREGYTFAGWTGTDLAEATAAVTIAKGSTGNRSYTATWMINQYVMTFVLDNGEENIVKTQDYDSALTAPEAPVKTGFTFKGWSPDVPAKVPASDQTFTAQWERNSYVLKFVADGVTVKEERVLYEGEIVKPEDPQKEGYTFTGWTPEVAETMPAEDITYTAQFTVNQYAVIYIVDDIEWTREYVNYGDEIVLKEYPVEDGQSFSGWTSDVEYQTMPAHDVVFTASLITTRIAGLPSDVKVVNIYDVRGTLLYRDMPVEQVRKQLPKGIYIINGRKYVVK